MEATAYSGIVPHGKTSATTIQPIQLDMSTYYAIVIDYASHSVFDGSHFFYNDSITLGSSGTQVYLITVPNSTSWPNIIFTLDGTAITQFDLYEGADRTGTTLQTVYNNNRNSTIITETTIHKGTSAGTTDGTLIKRYKSGSSQGNARTSSSSRSGELILKQNTKYILRVTSSSSDNLCNIKFEWFDYINKTA